MHRYSLVPSAVSLAVAAGALVLAACSETPVGPRSLASGDASLSVTGGPASPLTIVSDGSTQFCTGATQQVNGDYTIPGSFGPFTGCGTALDLTTALNSYNPGWSMPFAGSDWIGFNAKGGPSNEYRANPGRYTYQETFSVPTGVTNPVLDLHVKADNVAAVYLNGTLVGQQANTDCNPDVTTCNWNGDLHITRNLTAGTAYTLTFLVIDLPTGAFSSESGVGGPAPQYGCTTRFPQPTGTYGYTSDTAQTAPNHVVAGGGTGVGITNLGAANQAGCENPTGLDFAGTVTWTPAATTTWCSPGFWKNNGRNLWTAYHDVLYLSLDPAGAPLSKKAGAGANPTLLQVIDSPNTYGGPATNSVADFLSNLAFGTPIGSGVESCPGPGKITVPPPA